jgi:pyrroloquinoline-quinone synthase
MLNKEEFKKAIINLIEEKSILKHPFYQKWNEGKLTMDELTEYAKQYYEFVKHFPMFVSSVHSNCSDLEIRKMLLENLADEEGYKTGVADHPALWINFCLALGIEKQSLNEATASEGVNSMINGFYNFCKNSDYRVGLAALLSYEYQIPEVSKIKIEGLKKYYGISSPKAIEFFTIHKTADIYHSGDEMESIINTCEDEKDRNKILEVIRKGTTLYWNMLDSIYLN